jgi:hypothetical protein
MSKYHITREGLKPGAAGFPICGTRKKDRYFVVTLNKADFELLPPDQKCSKCANREGN